MAVLVNITFGLDISVYDQLAGVRDNFVGD